MTPLSRTRRAGAILAAVASLTLLLALPAAAQVESTRLGIRVFDFAALDPRVRAAAIDGARVIVADGGAAADWDDCVGSGLACAPEPGNLVVRIVREAGARSAEIAWRRALGFSVVDPVAGTGTLATVYINRVEDFARQAGADVSALLGRAIAHEIGHLILHTNTYGDHGLMRAVWTEQEVARNTPADWSFATPERRQIRAALQRTSRSASR